MERIDGLQRVCSEPGLGLRAVERGSLDLGGFADEARKLAGDLARGATRGLAGIKQALNASATNTLEQQLELERTLQGELARSDDYREGVNAFKEKRAANFKGR